MNRLERGRRDAAAREPAWDDMRERRVLARIKQTRADDHERARRRWAWLTPPRLGLGVAVAGTAAALALVLALAPDPKPRNLMAASEPAVEPPVPTKVVEPTPTNAVEPTTPNEAAIDGSRMRLPDGSLAVLGPGAQVDLVDLERDASERVALEQSAGEVRYEVSEDAAREFVVRSKGVEVRVIGTVFRVVAGDARVLIEVERGRVEVIAGERRSQLGPGDSLGVRLDALARPAARPEAPRKPDIEQLLASVDAARLAGDHAHAAKLLRTVLREHSGDPRATTAAFTLGRVERSRGRHREAARAFADYVKRSPHGVLAEDALAEQARSWSDAGDHDRARAAALRSLERWPDGAHAERMRELAGE